MYYEPKGWYVSNAIVNAVDEFIHTCLCLFPSNTGYILCIHKYM